MPPGVRPVERVYEADIIRNATKPRAIPTILPPNLGTTSRAYANARGAQAGLNIPNSTRATQGQPGYGSTPIQAAATAKLGGGSGGGGTVAAAVDPLAGYAPDAADLSKNPVPALYDTLLAYAQQQADARPAIFQGYADKFKTMHDTANQQLYDAYLGSRQSQDQSAVALGVDPAIVAQARDLAMRKNQENSDQSLADNQAWLAKAGLLSQQQAQAQGTQFAKEKVTQSGAWNQLEEERVAQLNLLKLQALVDSIQKAKGSGGGGGGRRSGGGSSSSGAITTGATDTTTSKYGDADAAFLQSLINSGDMEGAALFQQQMNLTEGPAVLKSIQQGIIDKTNAAYLDSGKPVIPNSWIYKSGAPPRIPKYVASPEYNAKYPGAAKAAKELKVLNRILPGAMGISSILGNKSSKQVVTNKASSKSKAK